MVPVFANELAEVAAAFLRRQNRRQVCFFNLVVDGTLLPFARALRAIDRAVRRRSG